MSSTHSARNECILYLLRALDDYALPEGDETSEPCECLPDGEVRERINSGHPVHVAVVALERYYPELDNKLPPFGRRLWVKLLESSRRRSGATGTSVSNAEAFRRWLCEELRSDEPVKERAARGVTMHQRKILKVMASDPHKRWGVVGGNGVLPAIAEKYSKTRLGDKTISRLLKELAEDGYVKRCRKRYTITGLGIEASARPQEKAKADTPARHKAHPLPTVK